VHELLWIGSTRAHERIAHGDQLHEVQHRGQVDERVRAVGHPQAVDLDTGRLDVVPVQVDPGDVTPGEGLRQPEVRRRRPWHLRAEQLGRGEVRRHGGGRQDQGRAGGQHRRCQR
jgi:hypothetical protein